MGIKDRRIKRGNSYQTTDGKWFYGKGALDKAKDHQRYVDFLSVKKEIVRKARIIFNVKEGKDDLSSKELKFIDRCDKELGMEIEEFGEFVDNILDLFVLFPVELTAFVDLLNSQHNQLKEKAS